ncbi:protein odr-4 homolog [Oncorhynchus tshawytscha]|uniref:Protein odr-4 homolog n=1 Tax=Oncorhynchus tshawytscha TaxID=74940 RepID=A0A8C8I846_ONCTS|nr:protein odr-4 homolog [Oncorhynchus tshawytscha]XP_024291149.1 protein odr-4 homolog [Oncorhynchus tshawytscha]
MGRGYIVEDVVEKYLSNLSVPGASCVTGLLIGQSSSQRDFVVLAVRTPQKDTEGQGSPSVSRGAGNSLEYLDVEWVTEHARQVSRMLPGGMSVIGVFLVTPPELSKEAQNTLRRLIFAVDKHISKGRLWSLTEEDVTEKVTLHICSKTRKVVCRTYDVRDPKSSAKPADWKYQSGVCTSWPLLTCSVGLNLVFPVLEMHVLPQDMEKCMKEGLQTWAKQIEDGLCLINGDAMPGEVELLGGQKKNAKAVQQTFRAQILIPMAEPQSERRLTATVKVCSGSLTLKGMVQCRAYLHSNKPRAKHATEVIKRDVINTVSSRVEMFLEDLLMEGEDKGSVGVQQVLPRRVFAPVPGMSLCVCDYMFPDECVSDVSDRLKEMLDWETPEDSIDTSQEAVPEAPTIDLKNTVVQKNLKAKSTLDARPKTPSEDPTEAHKSHKTYYAGVAMAAAIALLATGTSLIYLSD